MIKVPKTVGVESDASAADTSWLDHVPTVRDETVPEVTPEARLESARKLGISQGTLDEIDKIPLPDGKGSQPSGLPDPSGDNWLKDVPDLMGPTQKSYTAVAGTDPDHNAKVLKFSQQFAQPPEFIDKNMPQAEKAASAPHPSFFQEMEQSYPGSTKFYAKPENMAAAHDDMPNVVAHEDAVQNAHVAMGVYQNLKAGFQGSDLGDLLTGGKPSLTPNPNASDAEWLAAQVGGIVPDLPVMAVTAIPGALLGGAAAGPFGAAIGGGATGFGGPAAVHQLFQEVRKGEIKDLPDLVSRYVAIQKAAIKPALTGVAVAATGIATGGASLPVVLGSEAGVFTAASKVTEGGITNASDLMQALTDSETPREFLRNLMLIGGMHGTSSVVGSLFGKSSSKINTEFQKAVEEEKAKSAKDFYVALGDTAEASKVRKRLPEVYRDHIAELTKDGPVENLYIPVEAAEAYFQSKKIDAEQAMRDLGVHDSYLEAKQTGGDIKIPLASWTDKLAGTEHFQGLKDDIKFDPDDLTVRQVQERQAEIDTEIKSVAEQAVKDQASVKNLSESEKIETAGKIYEDVQKKLEDAGLSKSEIKYNPQLHEAFFNTLGEKLGVDPHSLSKMFPLEIQRVEKSLVQPGEGTEAAQTQQSLNQSAKIKTTAAESVKAELEATLGKDLGLEFSQGDYSREVDHGQDYGQIIDGPRAKRAKKLGFDTGNAWYHGTRADIESFSSDTLGGSTGAGSARLAHFFASSPETASDYAQASNDKLSLRSSRTEAEATRAKEEFTAKMREKHGSRWTSKLSAEEKAERAAINKRFEQSVEDFERSQAAQDHNVKYREYEIQQAENNVKFIERNLKTKEYAKKNKESQAYADKLKTLLDNTEWTKVDRGWEVTDKASGKKIPNILNPVSIFDGKTPNYLQYDSEEMVRSRIEKIESRIKENTREALKESLAEAKSTLEEMKSDHLKTLEGTEGQTVYKTVLKMKNPLIVDFKGADYREVTYRAILEKAQERGFDSVIFKNTYDPAFIGSMAREADLMDVAAVFDPTQIRSVNAEFDPNKAASPNILHQGENKPRGLIRINGREFNVELFKGADKSTFLHETGHYFLEVMGHITSSDPNVPEGIKKDYGVLLDWLGVKDKSEIGREQHEKFARGFEAYLREGNAPSPALFKAFTRFRQWLTSLYKKLTDLNVELTPEVRGVMDRMLATEEEIKRASRLAGYEAADLPDVPKEIQAKIRDLQDRARGVAESMLLKDQMAELTEKHQEFLKSERERLKPIAEKAVKDIPVFKAIEELSVEGDKKRNAYAMAEKGLSGEFTPEQATEFELAAETHGFADGEALARAIVEAKETDQFAREVRSRIEAGMAEHADLKDTAKIREKAIEAIHNERTTELLALEREALSAMVKDAAARLENTKRNRVKAGVDAAAAKESAKKLLAGKPIKDAGNARIYVTAERNAAARVAKAIAKGDFEAATKAKQEQLMNHALAAEAIKNRAETAKILKSTKKYASRGPDMLGMPYGFMRQVDQLLARYGLAERRVEDSTTLINIAKDMLAKGEDPTEIANRTGFTQGQSGSWVPETLPDFLKRVNEEYVSLSLPESILAGGERPYREIPLSELRDMRIAMEAVAGVGKKHDRFLSGFDKLSMREAAKEIRESIEGNVGGKYAEKFQIGAKDQSKFKSMVEAITNLPDTLAPSLTNVLTLADFLDRQDSDGPMKKYVYRVMKGAEDNKIVRHDKAKEALREIFEKHYKPNELKEYKNKSEVIPEFGGRKLTKEQQLSILLNWGNEGNRQRIRDGYGVTDAAVEAVINRLPKRDFDFAQDTWNHLHSYWHEIVALEMDVNGVEPKGVEPAKISSVHGEYEGGYYPISYDPTKSSSALDFLNNKSELYKQFSTAKAHTESGHTEARARFNATPVDLSLNVLFNHLENVVHDLEFRRAVIDVNRLLNHKDVKTSITNALDIKGYKTFGEWLKSIASDQSDPLDATSKALQWLRFKTTLSTLGFRLVTVPLDIVGNAGIAAHEIGAARMLMASKEYALSPTRPRSSLNPSHRA
jgi:hypothetical protein